MDRCTPHHDGHGIHPLDLPTDMSPTPIPREVKVAKPLTTRQKEVYDLVRPMEKGGHGKTYKEAAAVLGISESVVSKTLQVVYRKLGRPRGAWEATGGVKQAAEYRKPEVAAAAIEAAADPMAETQKEAIARVNEALKASGLPDKVSEALVRRLKVKYANATFAARELRTTEILEMLGKKIDHAAFYLDDKVLSEASARDLMLGITALVEKRNLLRGEPTAIVSDHERKKLNELAPALLAEIKRRGMTLEGVVTEKVVEPVA